MIPQTDAYWTGSLSMAAALALRAPEKDGKKILKRTLDDFLRSPLPSQELRQMLREEMKP